MFHVPSTYNMERLAVILIVLALTTSGMKPTPVSAAQAFSQKTTTVSAQGQNGEADVPTDQIIIQYKTSTGAFVAPARADQMDRLSAVAGVPLQYLRGMSGDANVLRLPGRLPLEQVRAISAKLMTLPEVAYAEPDQMRSPAMTPNDTLYSSQWDLFETNGINAPAAWDITTGSSSIVVADIDTGITNHADLNGRTVPGYDFIIDTHVANDGNGRDADPSDPGDWVAANECGNGNQKSNSSWHGTHTAGTIGAKSNNGLGVAGINWNSKILPVRVLGKCGGYDTDIVDGLRWAAGLAVSGVPANANPAKVANLSLGGNGACSSTWQNAINDVVAAGMVVAVAAGNSNSDASGFTPASCNGVITVAATNRSGSKAWYSNFGSTVEISAPGGETSISTNGILSTLNTGTTIPIADTYAYYQGTSMATPHVTGVVSLLFSLNPNLTPSQVLNILQSTAKAFPGGSSCNTTICGSGMLDAAAALNAVLRITDFSPFNGDAGTIVTISGGGFTNASAVRFNGTLASSFTILTATSMHATVPAGATTGPISVTSPQGTVTSRGYFFVGQVYPSYLPLVSRY